MGAGYYSYDVAYRRRVTTYASAQKEEIFSNDCLDQRMDPKDAVRECCETAEHPDTMPIIIGLDVTGSMGHVPAALIQNDFPEVMKKILDEGVPCPQLCFVAYGDLECDCAPLQIGQFEASDDLMEKWLTSMFLEGGGGGNGGESTALVYHFAGCRTSCDAIAKRGKKGLVITIGDEPELNKYPREWMNRVFGGIERDYTAEEIIKAAQSNWEVFHINLLDYSGRMNSVKQSWTKLLGDHLICVDANSDTNISNMIACIAIDHYKKYYCDSAPSTSQDSGYEPPKML